MSRIAQFAYGTLSYAIFYAGRLEERDLVSAFGQRYEPCQTPAPTFISFLPCAVGPGGS